MISVRNYLEQVVKPEVERQPDAVTGTRPPCGCELCQADITALSLTSLPPCYCMESSHGIMAGKVLPGVVQAAVRRARAKVAQRPKHRPGLPNYYPRRIKVVNFPLEEGWSLVGSVMMRSSAPCRCSQCLADTLAFALNRMTPLYGVSCDGSVNLPAARLEFMRHDLGLVLEHAAKTIAAHPHHA